jgi:hypothetical protein
MKTIALVTDIAFWKNSMGSHMRIQGIARHLAADNRLVIFYLKDVTDCDRAEFDSLKLYNAEIISYNAYSGLNIPFVRQMSKRAFFAGKAIDDFTSALSAFLAERPVDAVVLEYIRLSYLLDGCRPGVRTVLDMHDVMSLRTISLRKVGLRASIEMDAKTEAAILKRYSRVLTISRTDDDYVRDGLGLQNSIYAPYSVQQVSKARKIGSGKRLIFVGANTDANISGIRWFLNQVWPLLSDDGFTIDILGSVGESIPEYRPGVRICGSNDDLTPFFDQADISINPVFIGGGLKIKCLDALSHGLPCITTVEGAAGLQGAIGAGLAVATSRLDFAAAIRRFAAAPSERECVAFLAPHFVESEFLDATAYTGLQSYLQSA